MTPALGCRRRLRPVRGAVIIRVCAEQLSFAEIAYFFAAIVVGLVTAVDLGGAGSNAALAAFVLAAPAVIDQPAPQATAPPVRSARSLRTLVTKSS